MSWLQLILVCITAEAVAITLAIGMLSIGAVIAHAIEEVFEDPKGVADPVEAQSPRSEWFRGQG